MLGLSEGRASAAREGGTGVHAAERDKSGRTVEMSYRLPSEFEMKVQPSYPHAPTPITPTSHLVPITHHALG